MDRKQKVAALIANAKSPFEASDTAYLEGLSDTRFAAFEAQAANPNPQPTAPPTPEPAPKNPQPTTPTETPAPTPAPTPQAPRTAEQYLADMPANIRSVFESGLRAATALRTESVRLLKASGRCEFSDEELAALSQSELDRMIKLAGIATESSPVDFSGRTLPRAAAESDEIPPAPSIVATVMAARAKTH